MRDEVRDAERGASGSTEVEAVVRNEPALAGGLPWPSRCRVRERPAGNLAVIHRSVWRREGLRELDGQRRFLSCRRTGPDHD